MVTVGNLLLITKKVTQLNKLSRYFRRTVTVDKALPSKWNAVSNTA